jgi:SAM-dependent methyltransferase
MGDILDIHDWIAELQAGQRVLDVGSASGSFPHSEFECTVVALDEDIQTHTPGVGNAWVCATAGRIPFRDASFDLVICHHSLEHISDLDATLEEIGRVLTPRGRCFFSFPNGFGVCDGIYRFVFDGGGHVNRLRKDETVQRIEERAGVRLVRWQKLYSSFVYLRRLMELLDQHPPGLQKRVLAFGRVPRGVVGFSQHALYVGTRFIDRWIGSDLSLYGWALFFERVPRQPCAEQPGFINVCPFCGSGQPALGVERRSRFLCRCQTCGKSYPYFRAVNGTS